MKTFYSIQEASERLGIPKDTLRYYDRMGVVSPSRGDNRYRVYSAEDLIDLMTVQIMQAANFSLDEIKGNVGFRKLKKLYPASCEEAAAFLDAKHAEVRKKIDHLEKVSGLLRLAAETLRDLNPESDQRLAESVRSFYKDSRKKDPEIPKEGCQDDEG
ncbi:hypothetical protein J31TS4_14630 [Paenibacillus sp. J31TS4]|uniref:MerR family transcriptional regulator n=1 Tax=Paenibacillus sp. J31TS4 TaxID=2807195 RepID=UPI001B141A78|nr:MerR family transcriptional regulator [Paenibacillus sp. J31TS4]GIP38183.1 hypothetical protein J31TS4_14630 [Paenibacillus sp. J31TS4]